MRIKRKRYVAVRYYCFTNQLAFLLGIFFLLIFRTMGAVVPLNSDTSYHTTRQPFIMSLRVHLDRYCQQRAMSHERISPTRRSRSPTRTSSSAMGSTSFQHPPNRSSPPTPHRPVIFQLDLKPMQQLAVRNPYYNILNPKSRATFLRPPMTACSRRSR